MARQTAEAGNSALLLVEAPTLSLLDVSTGLLYPVDWVEAGIGLSNSLI